MAHRECAAFRRELVGGNLNRNLDWHSADLSLHASDLRTGRSRGTPWQPETEQDLHAALQEIGEILDLVILPILETAASDDGLLSAYEHSEVSIAKMRLQLLDAAYLSCKNNLEPEFRSYAQQLFELRPGQWGASAIADFFRFARILEHQRGMALPFRDIWFRLEEESRKSGHSR